MSVNAINVDSAGTQLAPAVSYAGVYNINVRQSTTTAAGAITWGLYNASATKIVYVRGMFLQMYFDGTAVATLMKYELVKYTGVTAFASGTAITPFHKRTSLSGAVVSVARVLDTGLTATSGTAQQIFQVGVQGRVTQTTTAFAFSNYQILGTNERGTLNAMAIELAQNELLALRQTVVSVIGDNVTGWCEVAEV